MSVERVINLGNVNIPTTAELEDAASTIFVHGWRCRRSDWSPVTAELTGYNWLTLDLPGHGNSQWVDSTRTVESLGRILAEVLDTLEPGPKTVVGHSMGAAVCLEAAALRPRLVRRVIAVDALHYAGIYPRQDEQSVNEALAGLRRDFAGGMRSLVESLFPDKTNTTLIEKVAEEMSDGSPGPSLDLLADLLFWDMAEAMARVDSPVELLASAALLTDEGRAALPAAVQVHLFPHGGHFFLREDPVGTAAALTALLDH